MGKYFTVNAAVQRHNHATSTQKQPSPCIGSSWCVSQCQNSMTTFINWGEFPYFEPLVSYRFPLHCLVLSVKILSRQSSARRSLRNPIHEFKRDFLGWGKNINTLIEETFELHKLLCDRTVQNIKYARIYTVHPVFLGQRNIWSYGGVKTRDKQQQILVSRSAY